MYDVGSILTAGGTATSPDMTFAWSAGTHEDGSGNWFVHVVCDYGGGTDRSNKADAYIPWSSADDVKVEPAPNPAITIDGRVSAKFWGDSSYVVVFKGAMILVGKNRIDSPEGVVVAVSVEDVDK